MIKIKISLENHMRNEKNKKERRQEFLESI